MTSPQLLQLRFKAQGLFRHYFQDPVDTVKWLGALQAQNFTMARWAIGIRTKETTLSSVNRALDAGQLLRTHVLRPTWHIVAAEDLLWMLKLTADQICQPMFTRDKALGIEPREYLKANKVLEKVLAPDIPLTRSELVQAMREHSIKMDEYRANHFLIHAEAEGLICSGADKDNKTTYDLVERRTRAVAKASARLLRMPRAEALATLASRYFNSRGPATLQDFTWWSGLKVSEARAALGSIENELESTTLDGQQYWYATEKGLPKITSKMNSAIYFLPAFDEYLISYKDRSAAIELLHQSKAFTKNGLFQPVVIYKQKVVATWSLKAGKNAAVIQVEPFDILPENFEPLCLTGLKNYAAFLGRPQGA